MRPKVLEMRNSWTATLVLAAGLCVSLAAYALAPSIWSVHAALLKLTAALTGLLVVAVYAWRSDEVQRRLVLDASAWAFFICVALALAVSLLDWPASPIMRDQAWAVLMMVWLIAWTVLRVRQR